MATDNVKRYFARAFDHEPDSHFPMGGSWHHDYTRNSIAYVSGYIFLTSVAHLYFRAFEYILLHNFPATAQRWCFVQDGQTTTKLQQRKWDFFITGGVHGAFACRFLLQPILSFTFAYPPAHWWAYEFVSCAITLVHLTIVLVLLLLTVAVCWIGDKAKQKTGWVSHGDCLLRGHCSIGTCSCSQSADGGSQSRKTSDTDCQLVRSSKAENALDAAAEQTHGLPPFGPGAQRLYGARDHYSKHPHNPAMLGFACHTPYQPRAGYTAYIKSLIQSPVVEVRKFLSPYPEHVSIHHSAGGTCAYHTITARPEYQYASQEELRLMHYQQQQDEVKADEEKTESGAIEATGTPWLRVRQFATSVFSNSTSTAASHDSFGRSSMGQRSPLVNM